MFDFRQGVRHGVEDFSVRIQLQRFVKTGHGLLFIIQVQKNLTKLKLKTREFTVFLCRFLKERKRFGVVAHTKQQCPKIYGSLGIARTYLQKIPLCGNRFRIAML